MNQFLPISFFNTTMVRVKNLLIETSRLRLRPIQTSDLGTYASLLGDPVVTKMIGGPRSLEEMQQKILKDAATWDEYGYGRFIIELRASNTPIGMSGVWRSTVEDFHFDEVGYALFEPYWGKGYTTEAVAATVDFAKSGPRLNMLHAVVSPENSASKKVLTKVGFQFSRLIDRLQWKNAELWAYQKS